LPEPFLAAGADGMMIEVRPYPELALSDSKQQLNLDEFHNLLDFISWKR
jgi:3-deoxy-7-phosphoheptulonate synthase/chorismate mutase